ncbi:hypothetical protein TSAR_001424 [Trichomalopsis sarcophagae]|uniref:Uncharacterized protein n=1 Tax=Trichomalopsis sarcophagae TaxID=543379 RepID=A0A232EUI2_9HYME|nr:hypothetical protein TSAR_001424 [Trichomalopsis sarcophagae]
MRSVGVGHARDGKARPVTALVSARNRSRAGNKRQRQS